MIMKIKEKTEEIDVLKHLDITACAQASEPLGVKL